MKRSRIFGFIAILFVIMFIASIFVPFYASGFSDYSLWSGEASVRIPLLIGGLLMIIIYLINVRTEIAYLFAGNGLFFCLDKMISVSDSYYYDMDMFGTGYYLLLISSIFIIILTFIMNFKVFNVKIGCNKEKVQKVQKVQNTSEEPKEKKIVSYDPMTGEPIYEEEPKKVNILSYDPTNGKPIVGYDTKTGAPIYMD